MKHWISAAFAACVAASAHAPQATADSFNLLFTGAGVQVDGNSVSVDASLGYNVEIVPGEITPPPDPDPVDPVTDEPDQGDLRGWYDYLAGPQAYQHAGGNWLSEDAGRFRDISGWRISQTRDTPVSVSSAGVTFHSPEPKLRYVRHDLRETIPAGSTVRMWFRVNAIAGNTRVRINCGTTILEQSVRNNGLWSTSGVLNAAANYIQIGVTFNAATITDVALEVVDPAAENLDIIILAGQSNATGASSGPGIDPTFDLPHPRVLEMSGASANAYAAREGRIDHATPQSQHRNVNTGGMGPGLALGRYYAAHNLASGRKVLLINAAKGSTKLVGNSPWNPGGTDGSLTDWAIVKAKAAVALNPGENRVVGVAWSQGESDYGTGNQALYAAAFSRLVDEFRSELSAPALPFVILGLNPNAISANATSMIALQESLAQGGANGITGVVHSGWNPDWGDGTKSIPSSDDDTVHFGADANRLRGVASARALINNGDENG